MNLRIRIFLCWLLLSFTARASYITNLFYSPGQGPYSINVSFAPTQTPYILSNGVTVYSAYVGARATNGTLSSTWVLAGNYNVTFGPNNDIWNINVPNDNLTYALTSLVTNANSVSNLISIHASYRVLDVTQLGADLTGGSFSDTAISNALQIASVLGTVGTVIYFPAGAYLFQYPIIVPTSTLYQNQLVFAGDMIDGYTGQNPPGQNGGSGSRLIFYPNGAAAWSNGFCFQSIAKSANLEIRDLQFMNPVNGTNLVFIGSADSTIEDCAFVGSTNVPTIIGLQLGGFGAEFFDGPDGPTINEAFSGFPTTVSRNRFLYTKMTTGTYGGNFVTVDNNYFGLYRTNEVTHSALNITGGASNANWFDGTTGMIVTGNKFELLNLYYGMDFSNCQYCTVGHNTAQDQTTNTKAFIHWGATTEGMQEANDSVQSGYYQSWLVSNGLNIVLNEGTNGTSVFDNTQYRNQLLVSNLTVIANAIIGSNATAQMFSTSGTNGLLTITSNIISSVSGPLQIASLTGVVNVPSLTPYVDNQYNYGSFPSYGAASGFFHLLYGNTFSLIGSNNVVQPGFETFPFTTWVANTANGPVTQQTTNVYIGTYAIDERVTTSGSAVTPSISQSIAVTPGVLYYLLIHCHGDNTNPACYAVSNNTAATFAVPLSTTGFITNTWSTFATTFTPSTSSITLYLEPSNAVAGAWADFDEVYLFTQSSYVPTYGGGASNLTTSGTINSLTNFYSVTATAWTNTNAFNADLDFTGGVTNLCYCNGVPVLQWRGTVSPGIYTLPDVPPGGMVTNNSTSFTVRLK